MSEAACKTALCVEQCLYAIVDPEFKELAASTANLAANNQLDDDQMAKIVDLFTKFDQEVKRRKRKDKEARAQLKTILGLDT